MEFMELIIMIFIINPLSTFLRIYLKNYQASLAFFFLIL